MVNKRKDITDDTALYTLQLPSSMESITALENFIDTLKEEYSISDDTYANMLTCMSEATINAIVHGNKNDESKKVYINLEVKDKRRFQFTVSDEGDGFNQDLLPDPTAPENLERVSGRGIFIIKHLADQCIFNTQGNEIELHFKV